MSETKLWESRPLKKRPFIMLCCLGFVLFIILLVDDMLAQNIGIPFYINIVVINLIVSTILSSNVRIASTTQTLKVASRFKHIRVYWKDVNSYAIIHSNITLNLKNKRSVSFNISYLKNRDDFIGFLEKKLTPTQETECLVCGEKIYENEEGCTKCSRTWKY